MVQVIQEQGFLEPLSQALGQIANLKLQESLLGKRQQQQALQQQQQAQAALQLARSLGLVDDVADIPGLTPDVVGQQLQIAQKDRALRGKESREQAESVILAKLAQGQKITDEERASLSPTTQRSLLKAETPLFEKESEKLEAKRVSGIKDQIVTDFQNVRLENSRLDRMEELEKKGDLSTSLMVKTLDKIGLPLSVLGNPDTEEFKKLEQDFVRDVNDVFRGQIRVFEIQSYLKTIPSLLNSPEGRKAIIRNRKTLNEMKRVRFDALQEILKENNGLAPANLDILIENRVGEQLDVLEDQFRQGITSDIEEYQTSLRMVDDQGKMYDIPAHLVPEASKQGLRFQ